MRLQVEVRPVGSPFIDSAIASSDYVVSGGTAVAVVTLPPAGWPTAAGSYHWQARTGDVNGAVSDWVSFGGNSDGSPADTDFVCTSAGVVASPAVGSPGQFKLDGVTAIPLRYPSGGPLDPLGTTDEARVVLRGTLTDADGDMVRLQVQCRGVTQAWTGATTYYSSWVSGAGAGTTASIEVSGLTNGDYYWRYRAQDAQNGTSAWTSFGGNSDGAPPGTPAEADFNVATTGTAPTGTPGQFTTADAAIATGGSTTESAVRFRALLTDGDAGDLLYLQIELRRSGEPFTGVMSGESAPVSTGGTAVLEIGGLTLGSYQWQYRLLDSKGNATAWTPVGGTPDFVVAALAGGGGGGHGGCGCTGLEPFLLFAVLLLRRRT